MTLATSTPACRRKKCTACHMQLAGTATCGLDLVIPTKGRSTNLCLGLQPTASCQQRCRVHKRARQKQPTSGERDTTSSPVCLDLLSLVVHLEGGVALHLRKECVAEESVRVGGDEHGG